MQNTVPAKYKEVVDQVVAAVSNLGGGPAERRAVIDASDNVTTNWSGKKSVEWSQGNSQFRVSWVLKFGGLIDLVVMQAELKGQVRVVNEQKIFAPRSNSAS